MRLLRLQRKLDEEKGAGLLGMSLQVKMAPPTSPATAAASRSVSAQHRLVRVSYGWSGLVRGGQRWLSLVRLLIGVS